MSLLRKGAALLLIFIADHLNAQYHVHFLFRQLPAYQRSSDTIYLAGSFNGWNPHDQKLSVAMKDRKNGITIDLPKGMFEYKFTLGSWDAVESRGGGLPIENHLVTIERDTTVLVEIDHWADHFPKKAKETT